MCVKKCAFRPWICIVCAFVAFHVFTTVRCYKRDGTMNCERFRSTYPNNWRISRRMWNTLILGLWNFVQLKCLVIHKWELCFKFKFASQWRHLCCCTLPLPRRNGSKGTLLCFPLVPLLLLFHFEGEGTATRTLTFVEDDLFI